MDVREAMRLGWLGYGGVGKHSMVGLRAPEVAAPTTSSRGWEHHPLNGGDACPLCGAFGGTSEALEDMPVGL